MAEATKKSANVYSAGIVGAGVGGTEILKIFMRSSVLRVKWICDRSVEAHGMVYAKRYDVQTITNLKEALAQPVDIIFEATGVPAIRKIIDEALQETDRTEQCAVFDSKMSRLLFDISSDSSIRRDNKSDETHLKYCVFVLKDTKYAIPMLEINEIISMQETLPVPESFPAMIGLLHLRGESIPIIDLKQKLGVEGGTDSVSSSKQPRPVIVIRFPGAKVAGFLVDEVSGVVAIEIATIDREALRFSHVSGTVIVDREVIIVLKTDDLF